MAFSDTEYPLGEASTPPTIDAPSAVPLNAASLARLLMALIAGIIIQHTGANPQDAQTYAGVILLIGAAVWNYFKNRNVVTNIVGALQAPAHIVTSPATGLKIPPVVPTIALIAILCVPGFMLPACAPLNSQAPPSAELALAKTNYAFEQAYNKAGTFYLQQWAPGKTAAQKAPVKDFFAKAYIAVQAAETANAAGNTPEFQSQVALVAGFVAKAAAAMNMPSS